MKNNQVKFVKILLKNIPAIKIKSEAHKPVLIEKIVKISWTYKAQFIQK